MIFIVLELGVIDVSILATSSPGSSKSPSIFQSINILAISIKAVPVASQVPISKSKLYD